MHVTTTMRYHLTIRLKIIKKSTANAGEGMERQESSYTVVENVNWYSHCGEQYGISFKNENRITIWPINPTRRHIPIENYNSKMYMHANVQCSTIYNTQDMEVTWISNNGEIYEEDVVYLCNELLLLLLLLSRFSCVWLCATP